MFSVIEKKSGQEGEKKGKGVRENFHLKLFVRITFPFHRLEISQKRYRQSDGRMARQGKSKCRKIMKNIKYKIRSRSNKSSVKEEKQLSIQKNLFHIDFRYLNCFNLI